MRINPISSTRFKGQVVIKIEDKNCGDKKAPMSEILEISAKRIKLYWLEKMLSFWTLPMI